MNTELKHFIDLVKDMRDAQKRYFRTRLSMNLEKAKERELEVDKQLARWSNTMNKLPLTLHDFASRTFQLRTAQKMFFRKQGRMEEVKAQEEELDNLIAKLTPKELDPQISLL